MWLDIAPALEPPLKALDHVPKRQGWAGRGLVSTEANSRAGRFEFFECSIMEC